MGHAQLVWSRGRKGADGDERARLWSLVLASRGDSAVRSNEEVADERLDGEVVVTISRVGWKIMLRNSTWLPDLLDLAECNAAAVPGWLQARGIEVVDSYRHPSVLPRAA
jgi:hypothetical protein